MSETILHKERFHQDGRWRNAALYAIFIVPGFGTYGYHYGWHNHGALLPAIYRMIDPSLLTNDLHAHNFPLYIREMTWVPGQMRRFIPLEVLFVLFQLVSLLVLFIAVRKWASLILPNQPVFGWGFVLVVIGYRFICPAKTSCSVPGSCLNPLPACTRSVMPFRCWR